MVDDKRIDEKKDETIDYLEVDESIPGQNYVCLSFVSPETLIQNKEGFKVSKFLQSYCKSEKLKFDEVYSKYEDFTYKYQDELQRDYDEQNKFQTSIRGIKVRGVFDTHTAAAARAKKLSTLDSNFHVFIGQVGYWLPWDPNADKVTDEVFQNSQLNDMMEKYQENNANRDVFYEEQKREKIKAAQEEVRKNKEEQKQKDEELSKAIKDKVYDIEETEETEETEVSSKINDLVESVSEIEDTKVEDTKVEDTKVEDTKVEDTKVEDTTMKGNTVDEELKHSIESDDPWIKRKMDETSKKE